MTEETFLNQRFRHKTPFTVPKDYFNDLEKRILTNIQPTVRHKQRWLRPVLGAACVSTAIICGTIYISVKPFSKTKLTETATHSAISLQYNADIAIDEASDFMMLDNGDFYSYVSGE